MHAGVTRLHLRIRLHLSYYSVSIRDTRRNFLRFEWEGQLWQFDCMPNGLALAPRKFTKLLKPVFATLREKGHLSTAFLGDSPVSGNRNVMCQNGRDIVKLLQSLGFIVHPGKLVLEPTRLIQYLGFITDSQSMTVMLTPEKQADIIACCSKADKKVSYYKRYRKNHWENCCIFSGNYVWTFALSPT